MHILCLLILSLCVFQVDALSITKRQHARRSSNGLCHPFYSNFKDNEISRNPYSNAPFVAVSPEGSYHVVNNGLELYLEEPKQPVKTKDGVNDVVAEGATVNSTFAILYGKVTFEVSAPATPGVVTAAILLANEHDEIDVELLGGDSSHWQTNIFTTSPKDQQPLWGVFGEIEDFAEKSTIQETHNYTIDWNKDRIIWSVDGSVMRTLHQGDTKINGTMHYPSHAARIQLGIWDASNPAGTSEWAKGPINWKKAPSKMSATFKSVTVECLE